MAIDTCIMRATLKPKGYGLEYSQVDGYVTMLAGRSSW
jgi:hypothetical protein